MSPFDELALHTLSHPDPAFIHQNAVDAYGAQNADERTKPIAVAFALIGLYLAVEKNFTGRQVQRVHMDLAGTRKDWPRFELPRHRGDVTVSDVLAAAPGPARDAMIRTWCASVWSAYRECHAQVRGLVRL